MTTRRLVLRAACASRGHLEMRASIRPVGGLRFASTRPATIADPGFWKSLIPKPFRKENRQNRKSKSSKEWNPATFFIVMFLLIGSMSIQMIALRKQSERFDRQSTVRMSQLREALRKLRSGEEVDVEKLLGRADEIQRDIDWEEMLEAIESDQRSQSTARETETTTWPEAQKMAVASEQPVINDVKVDKDMGSASFTTKSKSANLGNFF
ncbi:hypothetical protein E4U55_002964 [Claviceps digitariae]|nr:hypothetical protein E4U55_002964 [Claviceps digitariae]